MNTDQSSEQPLVLPVLPLKDTVMFPLQGMPLMVARPASIAAVHAAMGTEEKTLVVATQKAADIEEPTLDDVYAVATKAVIKRLLPHEEMLHIAVHGLERVRLAPVPANTEVGRRRCRAAADGLGDHVASE